MTFGDFLNHINTNPYYIVFYFLAIPIAALLINFVSKGEGHESPWCAIYSGLIYMVTIPGIFSILLNVYHMLFEKQSIYDANIISQVLPILSMMLTLFIIKKNAEFSEIPGFGKMTSFLGTVTAVMLILFLLNKTRLIAFTYVKFQYIILMLIGLFIIIRFGTKRLFR